MSLFISSVSAADLTGYAVRILDSDTIEEVLHNHHPERIRLSGSFLTIPLTQL